MVIVKVLNQKAVLVAFTSQNSTQLFSSIISARNQKLLFNVTRTLVQSNSQNQKVSQSFLQVLSLISTFIQLLLNILSIANNEPFLYRLQMQTTSNLFPLRETFRSVSVSAQVNKVDQQNKLNSVYQPQVRHHILLALI